MCLVAFRRSGFPSILVESSQNVRDLQFWQDARYILLECEYTLLYTLHSRNGSHELSCMMQPTSECHLSCQPSRFKDFVQGAFLLAVTRTIPAVTELEPPGDCLELSLNRLRCEGEQLSWR